MEEYRPSKPRTLIEKKTNRTSARIKHDVSELLKRAPHLKLLRSAVQSHEGENAGLQDDLLEDFRRMVTEDDDRIASLSRADEVRANVAEAMSWAHDRAKHS